ncbi:MAG: DUF1292 domain-containing protein [Clostridiales bacterium]|jgi:hypothetical protein|nr:DUF1292 domain-containing protein [Clostridiales bacterium]
MSDEIKDTMDTEDDIITLEFDDDTAVDCYVLGTFELDGKEYIALEPQDDTEEVYIYGYKTVADDEFELVDIEDDAEFDKAAAEFDKIVEEMEAE